MRIYSIGSRILFILALIGFQMNCKQHNVNHQSIHYDKCIKASTLHLRKAGIDIRNKTPMIDTNNQKWAGLDAILGGQLSKDLQSALPPSVSIQNLQVVLFHPKESDSGNTVFVFVDTTNYEAITYLGNK
jgi:hypothetical protein